MVLVTNPDGSTVNVPDQYVDQYVSANRARVGQYSPPPPPPPKPTTQKAVVESKKMTARERIAEKKRLREEEGIYYNINTGKDKGEKSFKELPQKEKRNVLVHVDPLALAQQGILAPSENIFFKVKSDGKHSSSEHSATLEKNFKSYILTGDMGGINRYLQEIYEKEGPRAAFKERERLISMGIEHTSLEGARQAGGTGTRPQRLDKEAEQRRSAQKLKSGQAILNEAMFGPQVKGELGATFDMRKDVPRKVEVQGPVQQTVTGYVVDGKTFKTLEEAKEYQKSQTVESTIPLFLLPNPSSEQTDSEKSDLKKSIESAYGFLETKSKDPNIRQDSEGSAIAVELGKAGLQFAGGILNLAESIDTSIGNKVKDLSGWQGPPKPVQPISFKSSTADAIPINAVFDKGFTTEAGQQIYSESKTYIDKYGWKPFVAGSAINLIGAGGAIKGVAQLTTKGAAKLALKIPEKIKAPIKGLMESRPISVIKPQQVKTYPEIAIQQKLTPKQIEEAQKIMKRIISKQQLLERFGQSTILDKPKLPSLVPSQKDVRLAATKPKNVQPDSSYVPRKRYEGGFDDILERGTPVGFKETKVPLGTAITKEPTPLKTTYADSKFRDFMGVAESGFKKTPVSLGAGVVKKVKPVKQPNYDLASEEARNFFKLIDEPKSKRYANIVGEIKFSKDFIPNKYPSPPKIENLANKPKIVEEDPLFRNVMPMKRLGGTKKGTTIKRKSDIDRLLGTGELIGPIKETKISLGRGTGFVTKTKSADDLKKFMMGIKGAKPRTVKKFDEPKIPPGYEAKGERGTIQLVKTEKILKPESITKQQQKTEQILKKKPKTPVGITWSTKQDTKLIPKTKSKTPVVFATLPQKKKKKQSLASLQTGSVIVETMLLNKNRPKLQTESKSKLRAGLSMDLYSSAKLDVRPRQSSMLISKSRQSIRQKAVLKEKPMLKEKQIAGLLSIPKLKTKTVQTPKLKTRTPQKFPPTTRTITVQKQPKITITRETFDNPPPPKFPTILAPPPQVKPRKEKKKKKSKGRDTEEFLGSTFEQSVLGFRSKKFDITYKKKSISRLLGEERIKFKRTEFKPRGKSSLSKGKAQKLKDNYTLNNKKKIRLF